MVRTPSVSDSSSNGPNRVRLVDLAEATGLSPMTVHRALNGSPLVGNKSRDKVLAAAERMGYRLNASARAMRTGKFQSVGLLVGHETYSNNLPSEMTLGLARALGTRRHRLQIAAFAEKDLDDPDRLPQLLSELSVDGLLIKYDHHLPQRMQDLVNRSGVPKVWINSKRDQDCVIPDDFGTTKQLTDLLIQQGAQRIVFISCSFSPLDPNDHYSIHDRYAGYEASLKAAGLPSHELREKIAVSKRVERCLHIVKDIAWPWAVMGYAGDDVQIAYEAARQLGHDLNQFRGASALGAISGSISRYCHWGASIDGKIAEQAVAMLMRKIENPASIQPREEIPTPIVVGAKHL